MKPVTHLFRELVRDFSSERWNEDDLAKLSGAELETLTKLLACPSSGVKASVIVRLLAHRHLRFKLARFTDDPLPLVDAYRRESLRDMCKEAGIWRSGNKRQLAVGLLNWRDQCRARGQKFFAAMRAAGASQPHQYEFKFKGDE